MSEPLEDVLARLGMSGQRFVLLAAVKAYEMNELAVETAAELAGLPVGEFVARAKELARPEPALIEFEAEVREVGMGGVWLVRIADDDGTDNRTTQMRTTREEEMACAKLLYQKVRVTVEVIK